MFDSVHWQWGDKPRFTSFEINGISNAMVAAAPNFAEMWAQLEPLMSGRVVVSYNVASDRNILTNGASLKREIVGLSLKCDPKEPHHHDTCTIS